MNSFDITKKFERLLFNGILEQPEQTFERDGNTNVHMRETGKSQTSTSLAGLGKDNEVIGHFEYNKETKTETFVYVANNA